MQLRTSGMSLRVAIVVASAILIALTAAPSISSASTTQGEDLVQTTMGMAASSDTLDSDDTTKPAPPQTMDGVFLLVSPPWWVFLVVPSMIFTMGTMMWFIMRMAMGPHMASHGAPDALKAGTSQGTDEEVASIMSGMRQIQEQNERILALLEKRRPVAEEESPGDSATAAADTQAGEEDDNARSH